MTTGPATSAASSSAQARPSTGDAASSASDEGATAHSAGDALLSVIATRSAAASAAARALDWPAAPAGRRVLLRLEKQAFRCMSEYSSDIRPSSEWRRRVTPRHPCPTEASVCLPASGGSTAPASLQPSWGCRSAECKVCPTRHTFDATAVPWRPSSVCSVAAALPPQRARASPRALDVFCGGGGTSLGFGAAGLPVAVGVDFNANALGCFQQNHPSATALLADMYDYEAVLRCLSSMPQFDVVTVSSPCTPFSTAGRRDPSDPRIQLTFNGLRLAVALSPTAIVFENVPSLLLHAGGATWRKCLAILRDAGYHVQHSADVDAQQLVPQRRRRLILIATKLDAARVFDFGAAVAELSSRPTVTLRQTFPAWKGCYFHQNRGSGGQCLYSLDGVSPPLRTNCGTIPRTAPRRSAHDAGPFSQRIVPSMSELARIAGWPVDAFLPKHRTAAGKILGNAVCPPVAEWIGRLLLPLLDKPPASGGESFTAPPPPTASAVEGGALPHVPASPAVLAALRAQELSRDGARVPPIAGTTDVQQLQMDSAVRDPDVNSGVAVHVAQLRRRERTRLALAMRTKIVADGTLRGLRDPIWSAPPIGAPPSSGNPAAMFAARPWTRSSADGEPTHPCTVSQRWRNWQAAHMLHCKRCQQFSELRHGAPPPLSDIASAHETGVLPSAQLFTPDPDCYQRAMIDDIRVGFNPPFVDGAPPPVQVKNGKSCWDEWPAMVEYMDKMDDIDVMAAGVWQLPPGCVVSAMHCVTRPSDLRAFERTGTAYPVRTVIDLTKSGVNDCMPRWPFRMESIDAAVRLIGRRSDCWVGKTDLSKYFPSCPLHPDLQRFVVVKDPRVSTRWQGSGAPTAEWLAYQRRHARRSGPYRVSTGLPLGLRLAPAFASGLSGEMIQVLTALGLNCSMYVDDMICVADTEAECRRHMEVALSFFRWCGFRCNAEKQEGPAKAMPYLGYLIDTVARTVTITPDRKAALLSDARRLQQPTIGTKDLETVLGRLGFAAGVLRGARAFTYRLRRCFLRAQASGAPVAQLDPAGHADAQWWVDTLTSPLSGSRIFLEDEPLPVVTLKSDASGELGWGYLHEGVLHWSQLDASTVDEKHIQYKELIAVVHAAEEHGESFRNRIVRFGLDNQPDCFAVNRLSSGCPLMMNLLRRLARAMCEHNFDVVAVHVSRQFNELADMATRFQALAEFDALLPHDVTAGPVVRRCRCASPASSSPVYACRLISRDELASSPRPQTVTPSKCNSSTSSAPPPTSSRRSTVTTPSPLSASGTWQESATKSSARTPRSVRTSAPSRTTAPTAACRSPTKTPRCVGESTVSSKGSKTSTRTSRAAQSLSASTSSGTSPPTTASEQSPTCTAAPFSGSAAGRVSSQRTTASCDRVSMAKDVGSATSPTAAATSPCSSAAAPARASTKTSRAPSCCPSGPRSCPPVSFSGSSSGGCTPPSQPPIAAHASSSPPSPTQAATSMWRNPGNSKRSPVCAASHGSAAWSWRRGAASAPAAPQISSHAAHRAGGLSVKADGEAAPLTDTINRQSSSGTQRPPCTPTEFSLQPSPLRPARIDGQHDTGHAFWHPAAQVSVEGGKWRQATSSARPLDQGGVCLTAAPPKGPFSISEHLAVLSRCRAADSARHLQGGIAMGGGSHGQD